MNKSVKRCKWLLEESCSFQVSEKETSSADANTDRCLLKLKEEVIQWD